MSSEGRVVDRFDVVLDSWIDDVPPLPPDRVVFRALERVATTAQVPASWLPWRRGESSRRRTLMWMASAAALAALAVAIGLTSRPAPMEVGYTRYTFIDLGFTIELPDAWVASESDHSSVARFATDDGGLVAVSVGDAIPDGGRWMMCDEESCGQRTLRNRVPFDRAQSLRELTIAVQLSLDPEAFQSPDYELPQPEAVLLDGEDAYLRTGEADGRRRAYVYGIHDQQPVVIFYGATPAGFDEAFLADLIRSFAFLGGPPATPDPADDQVFRSYINRAVGFAMEVPVAWEESQYPGGIGPYPRVARFGYAAESRFRYGALTVSIGTPDGQIYLCEVGGCEPYTVRTLDDIEEAIEASPNGNGGTTAHELGQLGGDPARVETIDERRIGGPPSYHFVYAFRDGRPVVLMFDYWTLALELVSDEQLDEMLRSFEALGAAPAPDTTDADADAVALVTRTDQARGFRVDLPAAWDEIESTNCPAECASFTLGTSDAPVLDVTIADDAGRIPGCPGCAPPASLEDIDALVDSNPPFAVREEDHGEFTLDGRVWRFERPTVGNVCLGCPGTYYHAYAFIEGRPVILRFDYWAIRLDRFEVDEPWELVRRIVQSFGLVP